MLNVNAKILVLSDIHIGSLSNSRGLGLDGEFDESEYQRIAEDMEVAVRNSGFIPNLLIAPGDLTSRGSPQEFLQSSSLINTIASKFRIDPSRVLLTYGNHDVDWKVSDLEQSNGPKRDSYCRLGALSGSLFAPSAPPQIIGSEVGSGIYKYDDLTLIMLNSGISCYPIADEEKHEYHHGKLGTKQLQWLRSLSPAQIPRDRPCVLMIHHHLINIEYPIPIADISTLEEGAEAISKIGSLGVDLVVHGHRHHPALFTTVQNAWKNPVTFLCAGSFGVGSSHRSWGKIPNTFHCVEFNTKASKQNIGGIVITFEQLIGGSWGLIKDGSYNVALDGCQCFGEISTIGEIEECVSTIIANAVEENLNAYCKLPPYESFDLKLKSLRVEQLNEILIKQAAKLNYQVTGAFPKGCILTKQTI